MRTTPVPQSSDNDTCCREDMTETGLKVFQLQSDSAMSAKLRDDKDGHMFGRAHLLMYIVTFVFKMTKGLQSHTSTLKSEKNDTRTSFLHNMITFLLCTDRIEFYFWQVFDSHRSEARCRHQHYLSDSRLRMKGDTMSTNSLSFTPWTGNSEDRLTDTGKQSLFKKKKSK